MAEILSAEEWRVAATHAQRLQTGASLNPLLAHDAALRARLADTERNFAEQMREADEATEAAEARAERAEAALREIADPENYHNDDWGVEVMYGTREIARAALGEQER